MEETFKLARENNKYLRKLYSSMKWARFFRVLYWVVIIGSMLGLYYFIQPYVNNALGNLQGLVSGVKNIENTAGGLQQKQ